MVDVDGQNHAVDVYESLSGLAGGDFGCEAGNFAALASAGVQVFLEMEITEKKHWPTKNGERNHCFDPAD